MEQMKTHKMIHVNPLPNQLDYFSNKRCAFAVDTAAINAKLTIHKY